MTLYMIRGNEYELKPSSFKIYTFLVENKESISQKDLAERVGLSYGKIYLYLNELKSIKVIDTYFEYDGQKRHKFVKLLESDIKTNDEILYKIEVNSKPKPKTKSKAKAKTSKAQSIQKEILQEVEILTAEKLKLYIEKTNKTAKLRYIHGFLTGKQKSLTHEKYIDEIIEILNNL